MPQTEDRLMDCDGYKKLKAAVDEDQKTQKGFHDYNAKLAWAVERAKHYAEKTGLEAAAILDAWEKERSYWYMNYYQDANLPMIEGDSVRVFENLEDLKASIGKPEFRCPACEGISKDPYTCDSGKRLMEKQGRGKKAKLVEGRVCDWKVYGLFGHMGKGVYVFVKSEMRGQNVFKPVAWEK